MDRQRNTVLETALNEFGLTHQGLADEVNRLCGEITGRPGDASDRDVRRWIAGDVRWPWLKYRLPLEQIFGRPATVLGFVPRGKSSTRPVVLPSPWPPASRKEVDPVQRRAFLAASAAGTVAATLGINRTPVRGRLGMTDIDRVNKTIGQMDVHFNAVGGGPLLQVATAFVDRLREAVGGCTYGTRVEKALHSAISAVYSTAGWSAHDSGRGDQAALLHAAALQSALMAADRTGQARAWSNLALQARMDGRDREAIQITRTALDSRQARQDPRVAALLHARLAIGQARSGDHPGAGRSLHAAERSYDKVTAEPAPPWLAFLTPAELSGLAAIALGAMGAYDRAEDTTVQALDLLGPGMRRNRTYYTVQLAELQLAQGDHRRAATTAAGIDAETVTSRRISGRLATVRRTVGSTA